MECGKTPEVPDARRWMVLAAGVVAITAGCMFQFGLPFLIPALRADGMSLAGAGTGRRQPELRPDGDPGGVGRGGRPVGRAGGPGARAGRRAPRCSASRRAVPHRARRTRRSRRDRPGGGLPGARGGRGSRRARGQRSADPRLVRRPPARSRDGHPADRAAPGGRARRPWCCRRSPGHGVAAAVGVLAAVCAAAVAVVLLGVRDAPHPAASHGAAGSSPYRTPVLWRIHATSALLVLPQFTVGAFGLTYLVDVHGWSPVGGGRAAGRRPGRGSRDAAAGRLVVRPGRQPDRSAAPDRGGDPGRPRRAHRRDPDALARRRRPARRRHDDHGQPQRAGLHRRRRVRGQRLGGAGPGDPEHRAERRRRVHPAVGRGAGRRAGLRARVRAGRRRTPAGRRAGAAPAAPTGTRAPRRRRRECRDGPDPRATSLEAPASPSTP